MAYSFQTFSVGEVLTATKMNQVEVNVRDHIHGAAGVGIITTAEIDALAVTEAKLAASAVSQAKLKTAEGTLLHVFNTLWTLPGGAYGFFPQVGSNASASGNSYLIDFTDTNANQSVWLEGVGTSYGGVVMLDGDLVGSNDGGHARQRYISASRPYDYGHGECGLFVFLLVDKSGNNRGIALQPDPPWAYNGPTQIAPHLFIKGKPYRMRVTLPFEIVDVRLKPEQLAAFVEAIKNPTTEVYEVTQAIKNADMDLVPAPMRPQDQSLKMVLLDPCSELCHQLLTAHELSDVVSQLILGDYVCFDATPLDMRTPKGVITVKPRWKLTP